jgi:hypothetical protein
MMWAQGDPGADGKLLGDQPLPLGKIESLDINRTMIYRPKPPPGKSAPKP